MTDPTPITDGTHVSSGVARRLVEQWSVEHLASHDDHWGDAISWDTARKIADKIDAATPVPANAEGVREAVNRIVGCGRVADWLTREGKGFQVKWRGKEQRVFYADSDDAYEALCELRTNAILALTTRPTDTAAREVAVEVATVERLRAVVHNDAILFGQIETRMRDCWVGTGKLSEDGSASNDFRVWMNEAHNRQRDLKAALGQNPNVPLAPFTPAHIADAGEGERDNYQRGLDDAARMVAEYGSREGKDVADLQTAIINLRQPESAGLRHWQG